MSITHGTENDSIDDVKAENRKLRRILEQNPQLYEQFYKGACVAALRKTTMFSSMPDDMLIAIANKAKRLTFPAGSFLARDGEVVEKAFIVAEGDVQRWAIIDSRKQQVSTFCDNSVGTLHLWNDITVTRFNAECKTEVVAYAIQRKDLDEILAKYPSMATFIIQALASHIRSHQNQLVTPLMEQKGFKTSITATTIAACFDAYFRSGMNSLINRRLSHNPPPPLPADASLKMVLKEYFPNMRVQVPVRIIYMNGLKGIRRQLDTIDCYQYQYPSAMRILLSFVPGVVMCPFSSVLEAANVTTNPVPLYRRWLIGFAPRTCREVMFGVGMNQLADWCASQMAGLRVEHPFVRYAIGSISAGWIAGYLSTIPHSMSTLRLMNPDKSYRELWNMLVARSKDHVPDFVPRGTPLHRTAMSISAVIFPVGVVRRSAQIAGTFLIINGFNYVNRERDWY